MRSAFAAALADSALKDTKDTVAAANRKKLLRYWISPKPGAIFNETTSNSQHGTHVAGTVLGKVPTDWANATEAAEMSKYNGLAYEAKLFFQGDGGAAEGTLGDPATCKNCIAVGASHNSVEAWKTLGQFDDKYYAKCVNETVDCSTTTLTGFDKGVA
eukprot:tig00022104_g23819.t1